MAWSASPRGLPLAEDGLDVVNGKAGASRYRRWLGAILLPLALLPACEAAMTAPAPAPPPVASTACDELNRVQCGTAFGRPAVLQCGAKLWLPIEICDTGLACTDQEGTIACTVSPPSGCGLWWDPYVELAIDGVTPSQSTCSQFFPDDTGGVLYQTKQLTVTNMGTGQTLCLNDLHFVATDSSLMTVNHGAYTADSVACPGAFASLAAGKSMTVTVKYVPKPGVAGQATLHIFSNDCGGRSVVDLCFDIAPQGPVVQVSAQKLQFTLSAAPPPQCVSIGNRGDKALVVTQLASIEPANFEYTIVSQPAVGTTIPPLGAPGNSVAQPQLLEICVQFTPSEKPTNNEAQLVIHTNDPQTPDALVELD